MKGSIYPEISNADAVKEWERISGRMAKQPTKPPTTEKPTACEICRRFSYHDKDTGEVKKLKIYWSSAQARWTCLGCYG